jgi:hypothetical protein
VEALLRDRLEAAGPERRWRGLLAAARDLVEAHAELRTSEAARLVDPKALLKLRLAVLRLEGDEDDRGRKMLDR